MVPVLVYIRHDRTLSRQNGVVLTSQVGEIRTVAL